MKRKGGKMKTIIDMKRTRLNYSGKQPRGSQFHNVVVIGKYYLHLEFVGNKDDLTSNSVTFYHLGC